MSLLATLKYRRPTPRKRREALRQQNYRRRESLEDH